MRFIALRMANSEAVTVYLNADAIQCSLNKVPGEFNVGNCFRITALVESVPRNYESLH